MNTFPILAVVISLAFLQFAIALRGPAVRAVKSDTITRIRLIEYVNPTDTLADGSKCDVGIFGYHKCDPTFFVTCKGGGQTVSEQFSSSIWEDVSYIAFGVEHSASLTTPAEVPITVEIQAKDEDALNNDDLIGWFNFTHTAHVGSSVLQTAAAGSVIMRVQFETYRN